MLWSFAVDIFIFIFFLPKLLYSFNYLLNYTQVMLINYFLAFINIGSLCKALPRYTVGSRQAEHESQGESMEEDDMVKSRVGQYPRTETNR